jgi:hypothetical protein
LTHLWTDVPANGPGLPRKWERRFALTAEYGGKAVYAKLIGLGTKSAYVPDDLQRSLVIAGWSDTIAGRIKPRAPALRATRRLDRGYTLLAVPRYTPFREALLALADHSRELRIAEISGCDVVTLTGTAPVRWSVPPRADVVVAYRVPTQPDKVRVLLSVRARDLLDVLATIKTEGKFHTDHIYDY